VSDLTVPRFNAGRRYQELRWPVFILGSGKTPIKNCSRCDRRADTYVPHDAEACACLTCHGFYAATLDGERLERMMQARPDGHLAVRTGGLSRLLVIDAEGHADLNAGDGVTGLDVLDDWIGWTGFELPPTLIQSTPSGGRHLVYQLPPGEIVRSSPRILPQVDIKGESGYIVVASGDDDRRWLTGIETLCAAPPSLLEWIEQRHSTLSHRRGHGGGGVLLSDEEYKDALKNGVKSGIREPFFARLSFELRKRGETDAVVEQTLRDHWEQCEQPPGDYFEWQFVEYKMIRDRHIKPDVTNSMRDWATKQTTQASANDTADPGYRKVGRVTMVSRRSR
jgi:hypothetical protein